VRDGGLVGDGHHVHAALDLDVQAFEAKLNPACCPKEGTTSPPCHKGSL
jgi:hypothetical protein